MDEMSCKVCFCDYGKELLPKILNCGHSLCNNCLANISNCPLCRADIAEEDKAEIPTPFNCLSLIEKVRELQITREEFCEKHVVPLREQILERKQQASDQLKQLSDGEEKLKKELKDIVEDLSTLDEIEGISEDFNVTDNLKRVNGLKKKFLSRPSDLMICSKKLPEPSFRRRDFENQMDFLYEIYERIKNGEHLYIAAQVEGKTKFGEVEINGSNILFHSLSINEDQMKTTANIILFMDVKSCILTKKFQTFLKVNCNEKGLEELMIIELTKHSLVPYFVKICTGECGPSYKGSSTDKSFLNSSREWRYIIAVRYYVHDDIEERGHIDYVIDDPRSTLCLKGENIVYSSFTDELGFVIGKMLYNSNFNYVIGKVITPCDDLIKCVSKNRKHEMVINDCGLVVPLNSY